MVTKPITLNAGEIWPCSVRLLKDKFRDVDINIWLGCRRKYTFETGARNRPNIKGAVVASADINHREHSETFCGKPTVDGYLLLYPVSGAVYTKAAQAEFERVYIDKLYRWYAARHVPAAELLINNVEEILIEYRDGGFIAHTFSYA